MVRRFGLVIIVSSVYLLVVEAHARHDLGMSMIIGNAIAQELPRLAGSGNDLVHLALLDAVNREEFSRDSPQPSPRGEPERSAVPPPVSCPAGQRLEAGECVTESVPTKYGAIAIGTKGNVWYGVAWGRN